MIRLLGGPSGSRFHRTLLSRFVWSGTLILLGLIVSRGSNAQTFTTLLSFSDRNGSGPWAGSLILSGSTLYGTTVSGGNLSLNGSYGYGTVFSVPVTGGTSQVLCSFSGNGVGTSPQGGLTLSGSTLYGMTGLSGNANYYGTIFSVPVTGGSPKLLGKCGADSQGDLTLSGSDLYGLTPYGGASNFGTVFSVPVTGGTPTVLSSFTFNGFDGIQPYGSLTLCGSTFYGMTQGGGAHNYGTIFSVPVTGGKPTTLLSFTGTGGTAPGWSPWGSLMLNGSVLYGMTAEGGVRGDGNVFSVNIDGSGFQNLLTFNGTNGVTPARNLTLVGSTLYGMTTSGGAHYDGTIFSLQADGSNYQDLFDFNGTDGSDPQGSLTLGGSTLYGTTFAGGAYDYGTVFALTLPSPTPEPSTFALFIAGAVGLVGYGLRQKRKRPATN